MTYRTLGQKKNRKNGKRKKGPDSHISFYLKYLISSTHRKHYRKKINKQR